MDSGNRVLQLIKIAITSNAYELLKQSLDALPFDTMKEKDINFIFTFALAVATQVQNSKAARMLLEEWDNLRYITGGAKTEEETQLEITPNKKEERIKEVKTVIKTTTYDSEEDVLPSYAYIFSLAEIPIDVLKFVARSYPEVTSSELLSLYIRFDGAPFVPFAMNRILQIYPGESYQVYRKLYEDAIDNGTLTSELFMSNIVEEVAPPAEKPVWVTDFFDLGRLPTLADFQEQLIEFSKPIQIADMDVNTVVDTLTAGLEDLGIDVEDREAARKELRKKYESGTQEEREDMVLPILENEKQQAMRDSVDLFHLFGPSFPILGIDFSLKTPCTLYGGCRMFLCTCGEKADDDDDDVIYDEVEWFRGACDECHLKIGAIEDGVFVPKKQWAVRLPRNEGGWLGCYCSWDCVRKNLGYENKTRDKYEEDENAVDADKKETLDLVLTEDKDEEPLETCGKVISDHEDFTFSVVPTILPESESKKGERKGRKRGKEEEEEEIDEEETPEREEEGEEDVGKLLSDPANTIDVMSLLLVNEFEGKVKELGIQDLGEEKEEQEQKKGPKKDKQESLLERRQDVTRDEIVEEEYEGEEEFYSFA